MNNTAYQTEQVCSTCKNSSIYTLADKKSFGLFCESETSDHRYDQVGTEFTCDKWAQYIPL